MEILYQQNYFSTNANIDEVRWNSMYDKMIIYSKDHNDDCNVPENYTIQMPDNTQLMLGEWLTSERA